MSEGDQSQGILAPHPGGATPISRRMRYQLGNPRGWRNAKAAGEDGAVCSGNGLCRGRYSSSQWPLLMENQGRLGSSNLINAGGAKCRGTDRNLVVLPSEHKC